MRIKAPLQLAALVALTIAFPASAQSFDKLVTTTVGWSEWCPPGTVHLDLETGRYEWLKQLRRPTCGRSVTAPIERATLGPAKLEQVREAVRMARQEGFVRPECRAGKASPFPVISNAGPPYVLVVSGPRDSLSAPTDLGCWSGAATRLHRVMEQLFDVPRPPRR